MSIDIKLSKAQLSKNHSIRGTSWRFLGKFADPLMKVAVSLENLFLETLATMASASAIDGVI